MQKCLDPDDLNAVSGSKFFCICHWGDVKCTTFGKSRTGQSRGHRGSWKGKVCGMQMITFKAGDANLRRDFDFSVQINIITHGF